ncbi:Twin-arginine translocation pathway signal [Streptomyces sp. NPDC059994]|uniref:Twin-arginine translocation pathway signal n=1 Tax=Streptomyces sp. NPDC059994 TaxID=3347029 RepID=UPI0036C3198C
MIAISRERRTIIRKSATQLRDQAVRNGYDTEQTALAIRAALPEVGALEAWRLALGWSRAATIERVADLYRSRGLLPPGLSQPMLCRWEHHSGERPGEEYAEALCTVYRARPEQLGMDQWYLAAAVRQDRYSAGVAEACVIPEREGMRTMTTDAGLPAVRESLHLALLVEPASSSTVVDLTDAAVEHYALNYSKHPPALLFTEVRRSRELLLHALTTNAAPEALDRDVRRGIGWLSALLGNLAHHLGDHTGARAHLATAATYGEASGDARLASWAHGAQAMVARATGQHLQALAHAERGLAHVPSGLPRAQLHAWAQLPALAALGRAQDADRAFAEATRALDADPDGFAPGRFGYDEGEHRLHEAEAHRALKRWDQAMAAAETSLSACTYATPGWAAASLALAQAEAPAHPDDAAQRALDVLERIPAARLRSTSRERLSQLDTALTADTTPVRDLRERVRGLAPPIDAHGTAATA